MILSNETRVYRILLALGCLFAAITLILDFGFEFSGTVETILDWTEAFIAIVFVFLFGLEVWISKNQSQTFHTHLLEIILIVVLILEFILIYTDASFVSWEKIRSFTLVKIYLISLEIYLLAALGIHAIRAGKRLILLSLTPATSVASTFIVIILLGTFALLLPCATHGTLAPNISFIDALFTSTSAVCVTGLIVVDTETAFSRFGQSVILILIQLGALGIMTYAGIFALALGDKMSIKGRLVLQDVLSTEGLSRVSSLLLAILFTTFFCELIGTVPLYFAFHSSLPAGDSLFAALFHSISAFCNAGFSTFSNSLEGYVDSPMIHIPIMLLIVIGGIGFSVVYEFMRWAKLRATRDKSYFRFSLHTRLVLRVTFILISLGFVIVFIGGNWDGRGWSEIGLASLFQSITTRTAGFNSIPLSMLAPWCLVVFMMLMFVGGAPGGTAGGIKVSTLGVLFHSAKSLLKGREHVEIMQRTLPEKVVRSAFVISGLAANYVTFTIVLLTWAEPICLFSI